MQIEANKRHTLKSIFRAQRFKNKFLNKSSRISANNSGKYVENISQTKHLISGTMIRKCV